MERIQGTKFLGYELEKWGFLTFEDILAFRNEACNIIFVSKLQMIVEEMNILTTVFLRYDSEKIYYPNSVLASKPISNFYRSPNMSDTIDFAVDMATSVESIGALKTKIKE